MLLLASRVVFSEMNILEARLAFLNAHITHVVYINEQF